MKSQTLVMDSTSPEENVLRVLCAATDQNPNMVKEAESQLIKWESQPGFFAMLAKFCIYKQLVGDVEGEKVRWMAAVYLKNGINKYWRRSTRAEIAKEEKHQIRELLLTNISTEPSKPVASQVAFLISRIARIDCPNEWPELVPELMKQLQNSSASNSIQQQRILLVLHQVVKALASRRMMAEKKIFEELSRNIFDYIQNLWENFTRLFFHQLEAERTAAQNTLDRAHLSLRILRKLTLYGFGTNPQRTESCMHFIDKLFPCLKECLLCRNELLLHCRTEVSLIELMEKFILKQVKTINEFQSMHPKPFAPFVPIALDFSFHHVFHEGARLIFTGNIINFPNFAIQCINLMKNIMMCCFYDNNSDCESLINLGEFFTNERLCYICEKIIMHYFLLTNLEMEAWLDDPEGFAQDDSGGESWKYSLRPSVETLYVTCFTQYKNEMIDEVLKYIRKSQEIQLTPTSDLKDVLLKDAIYNAAGLAAFYFFNDVDFGVWFNSQLLLELQIPSDNFRILRRRIIWLIGEWAQVRFSRELRPMAYEACLHLLRSSEDMSVRLAASRTINILICDFEFAPIHFLPYLEPSFNALFLLLGQSKECETKMNVLTIMSMLVEKMSDNIGKQANNLVSYLPLLWEESENYNMLRCTILSTLQQVVKAIREIPEKLQIFLYEVIVLSTNLKEPSHIYLMEEGIALWIAVVENSTKNSEQLLGLCKNLLPIIEMSSENFRPVFVLIQDYLILDARSYLEMYGEKFVCFCVRMFHDIRAGGIVMILKTFETILKSDAEYGLGLLRTALPFIFEQVYLNKEFPMLMGMYLMMLARVLLIDQSVFTEVVQTLRYPDALEKILDVWVAKMPLVTEVEKQKLFSLAFCSIFANNPLIVERFPSMMQNIGDALMEIMREESDDEEEHNNITSGAKPKKMYDSLVFLGEQDLDASSYCIMEDFDCKSYHYDRCRQLSLKDPVHKTALPNYMEWQLNCLRTQIGEEDYQRLMRSVYPAVLLKISKFVKLHLNFTPA